MRRGETYRNIKAASDLDIYINSVIEHGLHNNIYEIYYVMKNNHKLLMLPNGIGTDRILIKHEDLTNWEVVNE